MTRIAAALVLVVTLAIVAPASSGLAQSGAPQSPSMPGTTPGPKQKAKSKSKAKSKRKPAAKTKAKAKTKTKAKPKRKPAPPRAPVRRGRPITETRTFDVEISGHYERTNTWFYPSTRPEIPPYKGKESETMTWSGSGTARVSAYGWPGDWRQIWLLGGDTFTGSVTAFSHRSSSTVPQQDLAGSDSWHSCTATGRQNLAAASPLHGGIGGSLDPLSLTARVREAKVTVSVSQGGDCPGISPAPSPQVLNLSSTLFGWAVPDGHVRSCYPIGSYKTGWLDSCIITRTDRQEVGGGGYRELTEHWTIDIALKRR